MKITYPVAIDSNYAIWKAFQQRISGPRTTSSTAKAKIRYHHFGEGEYDESERSDPATACGGKFALNRWRWFKSRRPVRRLLPDLGDVQSPETYIGYERRQNLRFAGGNRRRIRRSLHGARPPECESSGALIGKLEGSGRASNAGHCAGQNRIPVPRARFAPRVWDPRRTASPFASACSWMVLRRSMTAELMWTARGMGP